MKLWWMQFFNQNILAQVLEGLNNIFQPTGNDNEDTLIQMYNVTSQSTQMLPQLIQKMQKRRH